jgi:hypothetical protein
VALHDSRHECGDLLVLTCRLESCARQFLLCSRCYRGNKYCSSECAGTARAERVRIAKWKHAHSPAGLAAQRTRARRAYLKRTRENTLTDRSSNASVDPAKLQARTALRVGSGSARPKHADNFSIFEIMRPSSEPRGHLRCAWCGRAGTGVLLGTSRFRR